MLYFFLKEQKAGSERKFVFGFLGSLIVALGLFLYFFNKPLFLEFSRMEAPKGEDQFYIFHIGNRLVYWLGAWEIFVHPWIMGPGLSTFSEIYPTLGLNIIYPLSMLPPHAHSLYVQTATETGFIGISLFFACSIVLLIKILKRLIDGSKNKSKKL